MIIKLVCTILYGITPGVEEDRNNNCDKMI